MLFPVYIAIGAALAFYLAIPLAGAFRLRSQWRRFRHRVIELSLSPQLDYRDVARESGAGAGPAEALGRFRLYGKLEALEGKDTIWIKGGSTSAVADLSRASVYALSSKAEEPAPVERIAWRSVSSIAEGTSVFIGGWVVSSKGRAAFVDTPEEPLIVVLHDGSPEGLLSRLVAGGRGQNEYWNPLARVSVAAGILVTCLLLVTLLKGGTIPSVKVLAVIAGLAPFLPFAPPGLFLFLAYRRLWRRALTLRTARDLLRLPLRYFTESSESNRLDAEASSAPLPDGGLYRRRRLTPGEDPLPGSVPVEYPGATARSARGGSIVFFPVESADPAAEKVFLPDDPARLAQAVSAQAQAAAIGAGLLFSAAILGNYVLAFLVWRALS